ncbi:MAG: hypothetical protein ABEK59_09860 [Halobacteria archaeon]
MELEDNLEKLEAEMGDSLVAVFKIGYDGSKDLESGRGFDVLYGNGSPEPELGGVMNVINEIDLREINTMVNEVGRGYLDGVMNLGSHGYSVEVFDEGMVVLVEYNDELLVVILDTVRSRIIEVLERVF